MIMSQLPNISLVCLLLCAFCAISHGFKETKMYGISHVAITVADLPKASAYYQTLGGKKVDKLSTAGVWGNGLYYSMFQKQILAANAANAPTSNYAVCNIMDSGSQEIAWDFVLFDDFLIQLIQCQVRGTATAVNYNRPNYVATGAAGIYGHMALWVHSEANCRDFSSGVLQAEADQSSSFTGFQTGGPPPAGLTEAERLALCRSNFTVNCMGGLGPGTIFTATRGMDGEKIEFACRNHEATEEVVTEWCHKGAIQKEMMPIEDRKETSTSATEKLVGMHHISTTVFDRAAGRAFYEKVIGAEFSEGFSFPGFVGSNLMYQDDNFEAISRNIPNTKDDYAKFGIFQDYTSPPYAMGGEIDFYLIDNTFFETYHFSPSNPETTRLKELAKPEERYLSPGYVRSFVTGLWLFEEEDFDAMSEGLENRAFANGLKSVKTNRADGMDQNVGSNRPNSQPMTEGDLAGYNFVYFNSPSGDTYSLVQFKGAAREALREAMVNYGSISKAFDEINPLKKGQLNTFCCSHKVNTTDDGSVDFCSACRASDQLCLIVGLIGLVVKYLFE